MVNQKAAITRRMEISIYPMGLRRRSHKIAKRFCQPANKYWQKKAARSPRVLAYKALAAKLTKACYYIIRDQTRI